MTAKFVATFLGSVVFTTCIYLYVDHAIRLQLVEHQAAICMDVLKIKDSK